MTRRNHVSSDSNAAMTARASIRIAQGYVAAGILGMFVLAALTAPLISPEAIGSVHPNSGNLAPQPALPNSPGWRYLLGTDAVGHSILMWVVSGARWSLSVAFASSVIACALGWLLSRVPGARRTVVPAARFMGAMPLFLLSCILLVDTRGASVGATIAIFGLAATPAQAVQASNSTGVWVPRAVTARILRLTSRLLVVQGAVDFLGFGAQPPQASWGAALVHVTDFMAAGNWWWLLFPGASLACASLCCRCLARALDHQAR
ncbi:MAG: ABC transporter permease [Chloroflexota bacterium]